MSTDLKPCPFCGSHATLEDDRLVWFVRCDGCGAVVMGDRAPEPEVEMPGEYWDPFRQSAIDHWNRRAAVAGDQADYRALCAELLSALLEYGNAIHYHDYHELIRRAETALDQPPTAGPTDEDLYDLAEVFNGDTVPAITRALELWGRPAAAPAAPPLIVPDMNRPGTMLPPLSMRMPADVVADLDGHAARLGCSRIALIRSLLAQQLEELRKGDGRAILARLEQQP